MLDRLKEGWRRFAASKPGHRFMDRYRRRHEQDASALSLGRILHVSAGLLLVLAGIFFIAAPGPGWATVFFGLAIIAGESRPVAEALDWLEVRAWRLLYFARDVWNGASGAGKAVIVAVAALLTVAALYAAYALLLA